MLSCTMLYHATCCVHFFVRRIGKNYCNNYLRSFLTLHKVRCMLGVGRSWISSRSGETGVGKDARHCPVMNSVQRERVRRYLDLVGLHLRRRVYLPSSPTRTRETEDLFQEGCLGLIRAAVSYDPDCDGEFAPYALARIRASVHKAIYEHFATVRVPIGTLHRRKHAMRSQEQASEPGRQDPYVMRCVAIQMDMDEFADRRKRASVLPDLPSTEACTDSIGQHLRDKLSIVLEEAIRRTSRRCRRSGALDILQVLASERLAIPDEQRRTPLRAIARRFSVSLGRVVNWQRNLERVARSILCDDEEFKLLDEAWKSCHPDREQPIEPLLARELDASRRRSLRRAGEAGGGRGEKVLVAVLRKAGPCPIDLAEQLFAALGTAAQRQVLAEVIHARG